MYELLIDDLVAAQLFGFLDHGSAMAYRLGMGDGFTKYSPGLIVLARSMEHLRDDGICSIDYGEPGVDDYKKHLGGQKKQLLGLSGNRGMITLLSAISRHM